MTRLISTSMYILTNNLLRHSQIYLLSPALGSIPGTADMYTGPETFCPGAKQIDNVRHRHGQLVLVLSTLARGFPFILRRGEKIEKCHSHTLATSSEITILSRSDLGQMGFISQPRVRGKNTFLLSSELWAGYPISLQWI